VPAGLFRLTRCEAFHAFAFATCITFGAAHGAVAQSDPMVERRPQILAAGDSIIEYPCLTLAEVIARALAVSPNVASGAGGVQNARSSQFVAFGAFLPSLLVTTAIVRSYGLAATNAFGASSNPGTVPTVPIVATGMGTGVSPGVSTGTGISSGVGTGIGAGSSLGGAAVNSGVRGVSTLNGENIGIAAAVDLFTGGRRRANVAMARAGLHAARSTYAQASFAARLSVTQAFYEVVRATEIVRVAREALEQAELLLRYTQDMFRAGTVMRSDLLRAELQVTTTQEQLLATSDTLVAATYALGWLAGVDGPAGALEDSDSQALRPLALDDSVIIRFAADASPAVAAAEAAAASNEAALRLALTQYFPTITAAAGYNWVVNDPKVARVTKGRPGWSFILGTSYPVFNGFQREDVVIRAQSAAHLARVTARDTRRSARWSAAQLLGTLRTARGSIALGTVAVVSAREDLRVQILRYRAGISTMLDVLTSETALVQAEFSLAQARHQYHTTRAAIESLLGRLL
jgi:outer membrane protein TolC